MRRFTTVDLDENLGDVKAAASRAPIVITEQGEDRFVIMSIEDFERLRKSGVPQRAFGAGETPPEIAAPLLAVIDRILEEPGVWRAEETRAQIEAGLKSLRAGKSEDGEAVFDRLEAEIDEDERRETQ
jgi:prevent-host-death family protein